MTLLAFMIFLGSLVTVKGPVGHLSLFLPKIDLFGVRMSKFSISCTMFPIAIG